MSLLLSTFFVPLATVCHMLCVYLSCTSWSLIVFAFYSDLVTVLLLRIYAFQEKTWGNLVCILVISLHIVSGYYDYCIYWSQMTFFVSRAHIELILTSFC